MHRIAQNEVRIPGPKWSQVSDRKLATRVAASRRAGQPPGRVCVGVIPSEAGNLALGVFEAECEIPRRLRHPRKSPPLDFVRARHGVPVRGGKVGQSSRREAAADPNRSSFAAICGLNPAPGV